MRRARGHFLEFGGGKLTKGQLFSSTPYVIDFIELKENKTTLNKSFLHQKFILEHLSYDKIASLTGYSRTTIKTHLKKYNLHKDGSARSRKHNVSFGKKIQKGNSLPFKSELKTIETIKKLHSEGLSSNAIARVLDSMKIPTKKKTKNWHHHTIITILKREGLYQPTQRKETI